MASPDLVPCYESCENVPFIKDLEGDVHANSRQCQKYFDFVANLDEMNVLRKHLFSLPTLQPAGAPQEVVLD